MAEKKESHIDHELSKNLGFKSKADFCVGKPISSPTIDHFKEIDFKNSTFEFFDGVYNVLNECLKKQLPPAIGNNLFGINIDSFGYNYHSSIDKVFLKKPMFFRTDEPSYGKIAEIQCPGSIWGEYLLLLSIYKEDQANSFLDSFVNTLFSFKESPKVHHLLDNASRPRLMKYFINKIRRRYNIPFVGFDQIRSSDANIIRTHSFSGLSSQNFFWNRINNKFKETSIFDYPPTPIFDQKFPLCLPFHKETKSFFSDNVRNHIIPTFLINQDMSFNNFQGDKIFLNELISKPRKQRNYFLKYAGQDTNRNWGSMRVRNLSTMSKIAFQELSKEIVYDIANNDPWVIQEGTSSKINMNGICSEGNKSESYIKYSSFFNDQGVIGKIAQMRMFYLVHGQEETVMSIVTE